MQQQTEILRKTEAGYKRVSDIDDGQKWLSDLKKRIQKERFIAERTVISPSRAKALLSVNPNNRNISETLVNTIAADIASGRFVFNGEPIILAETGEVNDGQHRLTSVVVTGKAIEVLLVAGVSRASRTTVDIGFNRTTGHFIAMNGVENGNKVAGIAAIVLAHETDRMNGSSRGVAKTRSDIFAPHLRPTKQETLSFALANLADIKRALAAVSAKGAGLIGTHTRIAGALCLIARKSKDWAAATEFVTSIVDGDGIRRGSAAYIARERLLREHAERIGAIATLEILVKAWNAHRAGKPVGRIQLAGFVPAIAK